MSVNQWQATTVPLPVWRYNRTICTGLGDRLGAMLTVASLAYVSNVHVEMQWCGDPSIIYSSQRAFMPKWFGFNYPLEDFLSSFKIPSNIILVKRFSEDLMPEVSYTGNELEAQEAQDQVYTLAYMTTRIGHPVSKEDFVRAYHIVGTQFQSTAPRPLLESYVVLHMRAFDTNTYNYGWDASLFCTHKVVANALNDGVNVVAISNDLEWAREAMTSLKKDILFINGSAFEDMSLLLSADGIIQHAPPGYSSYSNVPAMARGIPLISTYKGQHHRFKMHMEVGEIPSEFFTCSRKRSFQQRVVQKLQVKMARDFHNSG